MALDLKVALDTIKDFLQPISKIENPNLSQLTFESILKSIIDQFKSKHGEFVDNIDDNNDSLYEFGSVSLKLLETLDISSSKVDSTSSCLLSISQERDVATLCQLIVSFCIHYNLEDDVGASIDRLSKYGANIRLKRESIDASTRNSRLSRTIRVLWTIKAERRNPDLDLINKYFYRRNFHSLLCALVQLVYSPNSEFSESSEFRKWLEEDVFVDTDGALLVSSLLTAQGGSPKLPWFTSQIGSLLTKCLLRPNSVMNVVRAVLSDIGAVSTSVDLASDWRKCDIVARILVQCPKNMTPEEYLKFLAPQWYDLAFKFDLKYARHFRRVAGSIYSILARRWPQLTFDYFTKPVIQPLLSESITYGLLKQGVLNISALFVESTEPNWLTLNQIPSDVIELLFEVYEQLENVLDVQAREIRSRVREILKLYSKMKPSADLPRFFTDSLINSILKKKFTNINISIFDDNDTNDLIFISRNKSEESFNVESIPIEKVDKKCRNFVSFLKSLNDENLEIDYIMYIFDLFSTLILGKEETNKSAAKERSGNDRTLLEIEEGLEKRALDLNMKIILPILLEKLIESADPQQILAKHDRVLEFCARVLKTLLAEEDRQEPLETEIETTLKTIHLTLSLISVFTTGLVEMESGLKDQLRTLMPLLERVKTDYSRYDVAEMADSLLVSIATNCPIKSGEFAKSSEKRAPLIEEISVPIDEYERALNDVKDPLVPVKAHGLVSLRKLIDARNERCMTHRDELIELFMKYVKHEDSYIYLAAINGLISIVDRDPIHRVLDTLIAEYTLKIAESKLDLETRLKLGEVLTKTVRNFGELVPHYGPKLLNAFLFGCKHEDEFIRASSLSNLGETCKMLKYALQSSLAEIVNCLSSLIDTDNSVEVKRSASMVLKMIVEGLDKNTFIQVLGPSILSLFRLLTRVKASSHDDVIRLNCQLTNDYLNEMMKESMFPKQTLQKEIRILSP